MKTLKSSMALRVTVDEILDDSMARLLVAPLRKSRGKFSLGSIDAWADEEEFYLEIGKTLEKSPLHMPDTSGEKLESADDEMVERCIRLALKNDDAFPPREGRVYLIGRFTRPTGRNPTNFKVSKKAHLKAMRIDAIDSVKSAGKVAYAQALGGVNHRA